MTYCKTYEGVGDSDADMTICVAKASTIAHVGTASMIFTICGCVSVLVVGQLKDSLPQCHRGGLITGFMLPLVACLAAMTNSGTDLGFVPSAILVGVIGMTLFGPYKVLGTTFANDIGGKELKATACAIMGVSDNSFAVLMLLYKGMLGNNWVTPMFTALLVLSMISTLCSSGMWCMDLKAKKSAAARELAVPLIGS